MSDHEKLKRLSHLWEDLEGYLRAVAADYCGSTWDVPGMEIGALHSFEDTRKEISGILGVSYEPLDKIQKRINELASVVGEYQKGNDRE